MTVIKDDHAPLQSVLTGVGIGLRAEHFSWVCANTPSTPWFEILSDNYLSMGGPSFAYVTAIREHYPMAMHSVGMSIGSADPINQAYLSKLKALSDRIQPAVVSDHLAFVSINKEYVHELIPIPYTTDNLLHCVAKISQIQDVLSRQICVENVSSYFRYQSSTYNEWDFLNELARRSGCGILLDINNIYVSAVNHQFQPRDYLSGITPAFVKQMHLAGYSDQGDILIDNHGSPVSDPVWSLYKDALRHVGPVPTLIEWDNDIPAFSVLEEEARKAQVMVDNYVYARQSAKIVSV